jgi:hypothetical protein
MAYQCHWQHQLWRLPMPSCHLWRMCHWRISSMSQKDLVWGAFKLQEMQFRYFWRWLFGFWVVKIIDCRFGLVVCNPSSPSRLGSWIGWFSITVEHWEVPKLPIQLWTCGELGRLYTIGTHAHTCIYIYICVYHISYMIKPLNLTGRKCPHSCWWLDTWNWLDGELNV